MKLRLNSDTCARRQKRPFGTQRYSIIRIHRTLVKPYLPVRSSRYHLAVIRTINLSLPSISTISHRAYSPRKKNTPTKVDLIIWLVENIVLVPMCTYFLIDLLDDSRVENTRIFPRKTRRRNALRLTPTVLVLVKTYSRSCYCTIKGVRVHLHVVRSIAYTHVLTKKQKT